jgi:5'-methylthioadenosine phosphorylase
MAQRMTVGVIGGSGLYQMEGLSAVEELALATPFGEPSDAFLVGQLGDVRLVFLPRHGRGHRIPPSAINFRANIWGLKKLGVDRILSLSAVGSMREEIAPGDFVVIDQFVDRTRHRADSFFDRDVVAHVMFADPVCSALRRVLVEAAREIGVRVHDGGTYLCMEGPQFSTRAESRLYRSWGVDVIGMTNLQEAKLAREAEISYATVAMATDYDCWHESHDDVSIDAILAVMNQNVQRARDLIRAALPLLPADLGCGCGRALQHAIITDRSRIPAQARERLGLLIEKYL